MRNVWAGLAAAALLAAAFFLPAALSQWGDQRLLDDPHITRQDEEREGFAESLQLSVAEKLFLLRSSSVTSVTLAGMEAASIYIEGKAVLWKKDEEIILTESLAAAEELEEIERKWTQRLDRLRSEIRGLQATGALPRLWDAEAEVVCTDHHQTLYIDQESQVSFLAYDMALNSQPYSMRVTVDAKTGRILGFRLNWSKGSRPDWARQNSAPRGGITGVWTA